MKVPYVNLAAQWVKEREDLLPILDQALASGAYVGGESVERFEAAVAAYCGTKHAVALNSGTDALVCALHALGIRLGDEVITPPNSFIASTAAIVHLGAVPVFVDVLADQNMDPALIEAAITPKTRAIMPVHLTGRVAHMDAVNDIARTKKLFVIEDAAQSFGSKWQNKLSGALGDVGCFSAHPLKNLNACGDSGFVTTDDEQVAEKILLMRNHGLIDRNNVEVFGMVSRMDALQAAILNFRLAHLHETIEARRRNANLYQRLLDPEFVYFPPEKDEEFNTYHTFVIQVDHREELRASLASCGVETAIHYPIPIHLQAAGRRLGHQEGDFPVTELQATRILTLPINQSLSEEQIHFVAGKVNNFMRGNA